MKPRRAGPLDGGATVPRATYRLQLHRGFDFAAATAVLPYLQRLGVSHVYCSPIATARPGSAHGYDVTDPTRINPELGGEAGFARFSAAARALGLGLLLDLVPNHMGIFGAENAWWADVLENGPASPYAPCFDIDWHPPDPALAGKVLLPILGSAYGDTLDRGEIALVFDAAAGRLAFGYHAHRFPLDPRSYAAVLRGTGAGALCALADAFEALPPREHADADVRATRHQVQRALQASLAEVVARDAEAARAVDARLAGLNDPAARDALDALHEAQAYRLAHWRSADDEINYRRFFDVNDLAALRVEDPSVFEATQGPALALAAAGAIDGLRIDHPDGLLDPAGYFARLQRGHARRCGRASAEAGARPLYVIAEKIAAGFESVPADWAIHGTTGYRFAMLVNGLLVERRNAAAMERLWRAATGVTRPYAAIVREGKSLVARGTLRAQLGALAHALRRIALADRHTRDHGLETLRESLADLAACLPVYRTYVGPDGAASAQDVRFIDWAVAHAQPLGDPANAPLYAFLRRCLLGEAPPGASPALAAQVRDFALRFQQFSAPVAAKGVEDTAFYRYHRLVSLNEVGGDPAVFGISAAAFHGASADRAAHWPHTLLSTSTHDSKRSEDVRNRIDVISEEPAAWRLALRRWRVATRAWRTEIDGEEAPSAADQYLLHQTLLGTLPAGGMSEAGLAGYRERIEAYLLKAAREAKQQTSWTRPNAAYEAALVGLVRGLLGRSTGNPALAELQARAERIAWFGALNSVAMSVLKLTSPGVPDFYQGSELIELNLVDPDNRRAVDYALRSERLAAFEALAAPAAFPAAAAALARAPVDGGLKLWVIWRLLALRRREARFFASARYLPLRVAGCRRRHVIAFARRGDDATLVVIVGRKFVALPAPAGTPPVGASVWGDTTVRRPAWLADDAAGEDWLTGRAVTLGPDAIDLGSRFADLPFAAIWLPHRAAGGPGSTSA